MKYLLKFLKKDHNQGSNQCKIVFKILNLNLIFLKTNLKEDKILWNKENNFSKNVRFLIILDNIDLNAVMSQQNTVSNVLSKALDNKI
jgi:hypothetical protein